MIDVPKGRHGTGGLGPIADTGGVDRRPDMEGTHTGDKPYTKDKNHEDEGKLTCRNEVTLKEVLASTLDKKLAPESNSTT